MYNSEVIKKPTSIGTMVSISIRYNLIILIKVAQRLEYKNHFNMIIG